MMNEQVRRIMTSNPVVVCPHERIEIVYKMMNEKGLHQIPVVEFGKFSGIFSLHDLWKKSQSEPDVMKMTVRDVMNTRVVKITPLDKVGTAAELFVGKQFKTLPVVNLKNELKGVVSAFDILRYAMNLEYKSPILFKEEFVICA